MSDPLDDFLDRDFSCDGNNALKNSLRERTTQVLRVRQRMKWLGVMGLAAACYVAGVATMWLMPQRTAANGEMVTKVEPAKQAVEVAEKKQETPIVEAKTPLTALDLEWKALEQPAGRVANLLKAGAMYESQDDHASALRCYTQALKEGGAKVLESSDDDRWLLTTLKNARRWEKNNGDS